MNKLIELLILVAMILSGVGLFTIALSGNTDALALGRFFLGVIGVGAVAVGVGLLINWIDTWIY